MLSRPGPSLRNKWQICEKANVALRCLRDSDRCTGPKWLEGDKRGQAGAGWVSLCFQRNSELCGRAEMGGTEPMPRGSRAVLPARLGRSLPVASTTDLGAGAPGPPSGQGRARGRTRDAPPGRGLGSSINGSFGGKTGSPRWRCPSLTETWCRWLEDFQRIAQCHIAEEAAEGSRTRHGPGVGGQP